MPTSTVKNIENFFIAGINYKKTDAALRGQFAISAEQYNQVLLQAKQSGLNNLFILSTCNRTEIYGFAENASRLIELICSQTVGSKEIFQQIAYVKNGNEAIEHLFYVAAGLDSQILGDYEIVGQIKTAAKISKSHGCVGSELERLLNTVLQCSKAIKNQTELSGGTVSVSFAAIQYVRQHVKNISTKSILLLGIGKIGKNTCKNLVDYLGTKNITLVNRTEEKATRLAKEMGLKSASLNDLPVQLAKADIIFVATSSAEPIVLCSHLEGNGEKLILDLSIPHNVETATKQLPNVTLINVDELSKLKDETLSKREAEIPKAKVIISEHLREFIQWHSLRKHVPVLKAIKTKLKEIHNDPLFIPAYNISDAEEKIQRVVNGAAFKLKEQNQCGCYFLEAINEFIA
jgi:glutamyl-tRNA reductase